MRAALVATVVLVVVAVLGLGAAPANAHPLDLGYLRVAQTAETVRITLDLHVNAAEALVKAPPLDFQGVLEHAQAIAAASFERAPILAAGAPCTWGPARGELLDRSAKISATATCPPGAPRTWALPFIHDPAMSPKLQIFMNESIAGSDRLTVIDAATGTIELGAHAAPAPTLGSVLWAGAEHAGVAPSAWRGASGGLRWPVGLDHVLAMVALLLIGGVVAGSTGRAQAAPPGGALLDGLGAAGAVAGAHGAAAYLAVLGLRLPPIVGTILVGLTILALAAIAATGAHERQRLQLAGVAGMVSGLAASGPLQVLAAGSHRLRTVVVYHVGLGLALVVVVLALAPVTAALRRHPRHGLTATRVAALVVAVLGVVWMAVQLAR